MGETVTFYLKCLIYGLAQRADVCYVCELSHSFDSFFQPFDEDVSLTIGYG